MATFMRAVLMMVVLVGLPAAWIYYGPLPPQAQCVVDRFVDVARSALGWDQQVEMPGGGISAPRFSSAAELASAPQWEVPVAAASSAVADSAVSLATAIVEEPAPRTESSMEDQAEPLLQQLRALGAAEYSLEKWGSQGQLYRFRCAMPLAGEAELTQHFEAVEDDPLASIQQVVGDITNWHTARQTDRSFH